MKWFLPALLATGQFFGDLFAQTATEKRLAAAEKMFAEIMADAEKAVPQDLLDRAECAVLIPGMKKGAIFGVSGRVGRGFLHCRGKAGVGWSTPAGVKVGGFGLGFQVGASATDIVMLVMNDSGVKRILQGQTKLGAGASVTAGPVGRAAQVDTDALRHAEILTWSRARGVFVGVSLEGSTMGPDKIANKQLYGTGLSNADLVAGSVAAPKAAEGLIATLNRFSSSKAK